MQDLAQGLLLGDQGLGSPQKNTRQGFLHEVPRQGFSLEGRGRGSLRRIQAMTFFKRIEDRVSLDPTGFPSRGTKTGFHPEDPKEAVLYKNSRKAFLYKNSINAFLSKNLRKAFLQMNHRKAFLCKNPRKAFLYKNPKKVSLMSIQGRLSGSRPEFGNTKKYKIKVEKCHISG
jgi:hypothetical protein